MSIINATPLLAAAGGDYQISRSVRLRSSASAYFNRTPASATNQKTWTWSAWVKKSNATTTGTLFAARTGGGATYLTVVMSSVGDFRMESNSETAYPLYKTNALFRDPSAWYHFVVALDMTQATSTNRLKVWVNGVLQTTASYNVPAQNTNLAVNSTETHLIGQQASGGYFDGYITEVNFIDGQALTPSSFGETDAVTGVWKPKKYAGTYGTNGFYLNFSDNSNNTAATIGKDSSGNGNNWTPNNISVTAGVTYDSMIDVPTLWGDNGNNRGNYCILNPVNRSTSTNAPVPANGNLDYATASAVTSWPGVKGTMSFKTGKYYFEDDISSLGVNSVGLVGWTDVDTPTDNDMSAYLSKMCGLYIRNDSGAIGEAKMVFGTATSLFGGADATNGTFMIAIDFDAGKFWLGKNGTWYGSGDPATGANAAGTFTAGRELMPLVIAHYGTTNGNSTNQLTFGQRPFSYTPPSGFLALNTQNLTDGNTIKAGNKYFDVHTRSGTGSSTSITGKAFQPDLVWVKSRSAATKHLLTDSVRGATKRLSDGTGTDGTDPEATDTNGLTAFNSDGYTIGSDTNYNNSTGPATYVDWFWKKGATQGFDIVTYTGTGSNTTVAHGLNAVPAMMICKIKNSATTENWYVWHKAISGSTPYIYLNLTNAAVTGDSTRWSAAPSSTVINLGSNSATNGSGGTYVTYLFAEVAGFSKFGSYTGNGSADGPFVYLGFRPRYVMVKISSGSTGSWWIWDSSRNTYNAAANLLGADSSGAEISPYNCDLLSNGFKIRDATGALNGSTYTFIYAAFAENPFRYALAR